MTDRDGIYTGWERKGFYYGAQAAYGGADPGTTIQVPENTGNYPPKYEGKDYNVQNTARGRSYNVAEDVTLGRAGVTGYATEFDLTPTLWRDMMILLWQLNITNASPAYTIAPQTSGAEATKWASIYQYATISTDANGYFAGWQVESAVPVSVTLNIPRSDPDSEGAICTLAVDWIGRNCEKKTTFDAPTPTLDTASKILGHVPTMTFGGTSMRIIEANIKFTNGAFLSPEGGTYAPRIFIGKCGWSGNIKGFVEDGTAENDSCAETLQTAYIAKSAVDIVGTLATNNTFSLPILINESPQMEEVDGGMAINFGFIEGAVAAGTDTISISTLIETGDSNDSPWPTA